LFRLGPLSDPLTLPTGAADGPWDDPAGDRRLHLFTTRRGALLAALAGLADDAAAPLAGLALVPVRLDDPRPFLDLRDPARLASTLVSLPGRAGAPSAAAVLARADELGLAGVLDALPGAPTQTRWVLLDPAAARALANPSPLSPHDPDLVAVRRVLAAGPQRR
jgi:hypothetical protein